MIAFCRLLQYMTFGGFGSMGKIPTGCGNDLPTILKKMTTKKEKCKQFPPAAEFGLKQ